MFDNDKITKKTIESRGDNGYKKPLIKAALLIVHGFERLVERVEKAISDQVLQQVESLDRKLLQITAEQDQFADHLNDKIVTFSTALTKLDTNQQQLLCSLERVEKLLERVITENRLLEKASQENHLLSKEHYQDYIVEPMVRSLFPVIDFIDHTRNGSPGHDEDKETYTEELIDGIVTQLHQFFSTYEIEPIRHKAGDKFDPRVMRPVKTTPAYKKRLDNRVAESLQAGFWWRRERLLRPESVNLYKYQR